MGEPRPCGSFYCLRHGFTQRLGASGGLLQNSLTIACPAVTRGPRHYNDAATRTDGRTALTGGTTRARKTHRLIVSAALCGILKPSSATQPQPMRGRASAAARTLKLRPQAKRTPLAPRSHRSLIVNAALVCVFQTAIGWPWSFTKGGVRDLGPMPRRHLRQLKVS